jgi:branched-chain amino acid transport system ATP-binding protein
MLTSWQASSTHRWLIWIFRESPLTTPTLAVESVSKRFGGMEVLMEVSLEARSGEITGLIGPNGAGKTTLFNIITGFVRADTGTVRYGSQVLSGRSPDDIARCGVVRSFQDVRIFSRLTGLENIGVASGRREDMSRAYQFLVDVGRATGNPIPLAAGAGLLSFGNQKILSLARCLAVGAKALMLDEPAAGLHDVGREVVAAFLRSLRAAHIAVLVVEHDMRFVMATCDRIFVLSAGRILASGTPREIQQDRNVIDAYLGARKQAGTSG